MPAVVGGADGTHGSATPLVGSAHAEPFHVLTVGDQVQVFSAVEGTWVPGFVVAEVLRGDNYRLRRVADDSLLPDPTGSGDLRSV